jgi:hypothetical protein
LCQTFADDGMLAGMAKKQLDQGLGGSLSQDLNKLVGTIVRGYPQLKNSKDELEFGYKISFKGIKEDYPISVIEPKAPPQGFFDNVKNLFSS